MHSSVAFTAFTKLDKPQHSLISGVDPSQGNPVPKSEVLAWTTLPPRCQLAITDPLLASAGWPTRGGYTSETVQQAAFCAWLMPLSAALQGPPSEWRVSEPRRSSGLSSAPSGISPHLCCPVGFSVSLWVSRAFPPTADATGRLLMAPWPSARHL